MKPAEFEPRKKYSHKILPKKSFVEIDKEGHLFINSLAACKGFLKNKMTYDVKSLNLTPEQLQLNDWREIK